MTEFKGSDAFEKKFKVYKNNLLDMSHRNRMLFFRPKSRSTLELIHPPMNELFESLVIKEKVFKFPIVFDPSLQKKKDEETEAEFKTRLKELHQQRIQEMKDGKAKKNQLITELDDKKLERLIKQNRTRAKNSFEEQGINMLYICFGLLKWVEKEGDKKKGVAHTPLLYVPIDLDRKRVLDNWQIRIMDDDVILNPSLKEKFKSQFNLTLPEFPEEFTIEDFQQYFNDLRAFLASSKKMEGWEIEDKVFIGLFSFSKHTMYTDLVESKHQLWKNPIIRAIAEGGGYEEQLEHIPDETSYHDNADPLDSYHIMDCDSSQLKAIQFAKKGASLVIRGPPGTGKSQAISNIIAECLSAEKKVLFVAEKRAALTVVKNRLDRCGIGEFCLELHSDKANKLEVLRQIDRSLKSELKEKDFKKNKYKSLKQQRVRLNEYIKNIHEPIGKTGTSLYQRIGEFDTLNGIPLIEANIRNPLQISDEDLFQIEDNLAQLDVYKDMLKVLDDNPWAKSGLTDITKDTANEVYENLKSLKNLSMSVEQPLQVAETQFHLKPLNGSKVNSFIEFFLSFKESSFEIDLSSIAGHDLKKKEKKKLAKNLSRHIKNYDKNHDIVSYANKIDDFKKSYFEVPYKSSYSGLESAIQRIYDINEKINLIMIKLKKLYDSSAIDFGDVNEWKKYVIFANHWLNQMNSFDQWVSIQIVINELDNLGLDDFIRKLKMQEEIDLNLDLYDLFTKSFVYAWIQDGLRRFPNLANFNPKYHRGILDKFKELDQEIIKINRYRLAKKLFKSRPRQNLLASGLRSSEQNILVREMMKKRNVRPLRSILSLTKHYVTKIKPCFLMSPMSVAKYLDRKEFFQFFDAVIFDEASQVAPEDAIGAVIRGKQLIVVGDEKQLPPTSFFSSNLYDSMDDFASDVDTFDSILEECTGIGLPAIMLNYHYRSKKEGLIAFSNYHFYDNNLYTFPDLVREGVYESQDVESLPALEFHHTKGAIYDKGVTRTNKVEAKIVAEHIVQHYRNNAKNGTAFSLGVVAFSEAQRNAISNQLDEMYKNDSALEALVHQFDEENEEPLLLKNLENIQGDERDFIFFSIGFGKDSEGNFSLNFGPMNKNGGERRLNVAITRARYHVKIFCSFLPHEVDVSKTKAAGVRRLFEYLDYARMGMFSTEKDAEKAAGDALKSQFEESVVEALEQRGYKIERDIGRSKYRIDIAIVNPEDPNRYLLGIVCDGGTYKLMENARDRDRVRNQILKHLGWEMYHIFSPEWLHNKEKVLKKIDKIIKLKIAELKEAAEKAKMAQITEEDLAPVEESELGVEFERKAVTPNDQPEKIQDLRDPEFRKQLLSLPGVVEYELYSKEKVMEPKFFDRAPSRMKAAKEIIKAEGPIHWDLLEKRIKLYFGLARINNRISDIMEEIRDSLPCEGDFYYPEKYDEDLVRIEIVKNQDPRKFEHISDLEIENAMELFLNSSLSIDKAELFKDTLQLFGFAGRRKEYLPRLEERLAQLHKDGMFQHDKVRGFTLEQDIDLDKEYPELDDVIPGVEVKESTQIVDEVPVKPTLVSEEKTVSVDSDVDDIDIDKLVKEAEEMDLVVETNTGKVVASDIIDILDDGLAYSFDELCEELDIESDEAQKSLGRMITQLVRDKRIDTVKDNGNRAWKISK